MRVQRYAAVEPQRETPTLDLAEFADATPSIVGLIAQPMGAVFGLAAAFLIGLSDLFGRRILGVTSPVTTAAVIQGFATATAALTVFLGDGSPSTTDLVRGVVSGLGLACGLASYYAGVSRASAAVVAPTIATLSAVIPFGYAVLIGARPGLLSIGGAGCAFVGMALISRSASTTDHIRWGLVWGSLGGVGYGVAVSVLLEASVSSGAWPALAQRSAGWAVLTAIACHRGLSIRLPRAVRFDAVLAGVCGGVATVCVLLAVQADHTVGVMTMSTYPAFSIAIGRLAFQDLISPTQLAGLPIVLTGVALVAVT